LARVKQACCRCEGCWEPLGVVSRTDVPEGCERYRKPQVTAEKSSSSSRLPCSCRFAWDPSVLLAASAIRKAAARGREESSVVLGRVPSRPLGIANTS
jgi:hypothetical protein